MRASIASLSGSACSRAKPIVEFPRVAGKLAWMAVETMRFRVAAQAMAVLLVLLLIFLMSHRN